MPLKPKQVRLLTGVGLALLTLFTRLPFHAKTFFEFDSIDFAVATFRFSLEHVTPHMPGYIGHILLGRFLTQFTSDINSAFVWLSTTLSIISVLHMWRAGAQLRGERVGLIAAVLWLFTPLFWFYGEVATAYIHEALFASAVLYLSLKLLREPSSKWLLPMLAITLSISGSMRQNSILFFTPVILYVVWKTRQPWPGVIVALTLFAATTIGWVSILLSESGGLDTYLFYASKESIFRSQSVLFGNALGVHAAVIGKMLFYLVVSIWPLIILGVIYLLNRQRRLVEISDGVPIGGYLVLALTAIVPFAFYLLIYFMKAGYLLNVIPSIVLLGAVVIDELAIAHAKRRKAQDNFGLTRRYITRHAIILTGAVVAVNILWFTLELPGKEHRLFVDGFTAVSFGNDLSDRVKMGSPTDRLLNRAFAYTSSQGISAVDKINFDVLEALRPIKPGTVLLDTWWSRWGYIYRPDLVIYDVITGTDELTMGRSQQYDRVPEPSKVIELRDARDFVILIRPDHPDRQGISQQAEFLPLDPWIGVHKLYLLSDSIRWKDRTFRFGDKLRR